MNYYAHSIKEEQRWQLLKEHLLNTGMLARDFAKKFRAEDFAYVSGILHDIGKYSDEFQNKLKGENILVDHSTAGAQEVNKICNNIRIGKILAYVIAGHHSGLADWTGTGDNSCLEARLKKSSIPNYSNYKKEINVNDLIIPKSLKVKLNDINDKTSNLFAVFMLIRMLYSCLVDADFLDTEQFCDKERANKRIHTTTLKELDKKLDTFLEEEILKKAEKTELNEYRLKILKQCQKKATEDRGFFTLTVPTGGGKTISSLSFALKHAMKHNLERVIYVIPYTSIIEQNANVFRNLVGTENILEHHSNYDYDKGDENEINYSIKLASENWDIPIIVTTNVQFFESLFSNRSSKCRKLHNIVNSVIILDEAQMLPVEYLRPCLYALSELITNYNCSVVFCTATQPRLFDNPEKLKLPIIKPKEIIENPIELYEKLQAVKTKYIGEKDLDDIVNNLAQHRQVLCIVNTRKTAREIYLKLKEKGVKGLCHLSAAMCPIHRTEKIKAIKEALRNNDECVIISTQLVEAGVDFDFPVVFREIAGIDSIAQAAGRCNRERKIKEGGDVFVFRFSGKKLPGGYISITADVAQEIFNLNKENNENNEILTLDNIKQYYKILYSRETSGLDGNNIMDDIKSSSEQFEFPFKTISDNFKLIRDITYSIVVLYDKECEEILKEMELSDSPRFYARKLQKYVVQIYEQDFKKFLANGKLCNKKDLFFVLDKEMYSDEIGVITEDASIV